MEEGLLRQRRKKLQERKANSSLRKMFATLVYLPPSTTANDLFNRKILTASTYILVKFDKIANNLIVLLFLPIVFSE